MKRKHIVVIISILAVISIALSITKFMMDIKKDKEAQKIKTSAIEKSYNSLENSIDSYNETRLSIKEDLQTYYEETFKDNYNTIITKMEQYDKIIGKIKDKIDIINNNCSNNIYSKSQINTICQTYKETYEQLINNYINDIKNINSIITNYNTNYQNNLKEFTSKHINQYIDYNKDGKYLGKNNDEEK